jgi:hypothetical protein
MLAQCVKKPTQNSAINGIDLVEIKKQKVTAEGLEHVFDKVFQHWKEVECQGNI